VIRDTVITFASGLSTSSYLDNDTFFNPWRNQTGTVPGMPELCSAKRIVSVDLLWKVEVMCLRKYFSVMKFVILILIVITWMWRNLVTTQNRRLNVQIDYKIIYTHHRLHLELHIRR
jgi:hypothetical protein